MRDPRRRRSCALGRQSGEIWFKGANLIRGYWGKPEATAETIVDGWLRSGDIGRIDADGFVYVEDRAKDMVLRAGENVYCAEVEAAIYEHPAVYEAAVFGVPAHSPRRGGRRHGLAEGGPDTGRRGVATPRGFQAGDVQGPNRRHDHHRAVAPECHRQDLEA